MSENNEQEYVISLVGEARHDEHHLLPELLAEIKSELEHRTEASGRARPQEVAWSQPAGTFTAIVVFGGTTVIAIASAVVQRFSNRTGRAFDMSPARMSTRG